MSKLYCTYYEELLKMSPEVIAKSLVVDGNVNVMICYRL